MSALVTGAHSASIPRGERAGERVDLRAADVGGEQERQLDLRQRELLAEPGDLLVLHGVPLRRGTPPRARGRLPHGSRRNVRTLRRRS